MIMVSLAACRCLVSFPGPFRATATTDLEKTPTPPATMLRTIPALDTARQQRGAAWRRRRRREGGREGGGGRGLWRPEGISILLLLVVLLGYLAPTTAAASLEGRTGVTTCPGGKGDTFCYEFTTCCGLSCCYRYQTCSTATNPPTCVSSSSSKDSSVLFDTSAPPMVFPLDSKNTTSSLPPPNLSTTEPATETEPPEDSFTSPPGFATYPLVTKIFVIVGPFLGLALIILVCFLIYRWHRRHHPASPSPRRSSMIFPSSHPKDHVKVSSVASPYNSAFPFERDPKLPPPSRGSGYTVASSAYTGYTSYAAGRHTNNPPPPHYHHRSMGSVTTITAAASVRSGKSGTSNKLRKSNSVSRASGRVSGFPSPGSVPTPPPAAAMRSPTISSRRSTSQLSAPSSRSPSYYYSAPSSPNPKYALPQSSHHWQIAPPDGSGGFIYTPPMRNSLRNQSISSNFSPVASTQRQTSIGNKKKTAGPAETDHSKVADVTRMLKELNESQTALAGAGAGTGRAGGTSAGSDVDMDEKKGVLGTTDGGGGGGDKVWDYSPVELEKMEPISISPTLGNGSISEKKWRDPDKPQEKQ